MPSTSLNSLDRDEHLSLEQLAGGDSRAFWYLWQTYRDYLYNRCIYWMGGNTQEASEVLSIALLKAWDKLPENAAKITDIKAWFTRVTRNICIDIYRKRQRIEKYTDDIERIIEGREETLGSGQSSPESLLLDRELTLYLREAIERLPDRLRKPLVWHYYSRKNYREIARTLAISEDSVRKRIQRARSILRGKLKRYLAGLESSDIADRGAIPYLLDPSLANPISDPENDLSRIDYQVTALCLPTRRPYPFLSGEHRE